MSSEEYDFSTSLRSIALALFNLTLNLVTGYVGCIPPAIFAGIIMAFSSIHQTVVS